MLGGATRLPEAAYDQAFKDVNAHVGLDDGWAKVKAAIESHCGLLGKQHAVRVRNWVKKLSEETANVVWKKNRNAYARLLLEQLRCGKLGEPFGAQPPGGPLPTLPKHLAYAFKPPRSSGSPLAARGSAAPSWPVAAVAATAAPVLEGAAPGWHGPTMQHRQQEVQPPRHQQHEQQQQLSATEQLDAYLGRSTFRRAQYGDERLNEALAAGVSDSDDGTGGYNGAGGLRHLPGTRMQLRGAEGRRVDRQQLEDAAWRPSKLELEAQLGASRERQVELEWRLGQMEGLLRQHAVMLQGQGHGVPLGSLLDAIDDGHVSPPRQRSTKKELEELIERYEAKRRQWQAPGAVAPTAGGAPRSAGGKRPPPIAQSDEDDMLRQLDDFQRQTETIRRQLGGGGGGSPGDAATAPPPGLRPLESSLAGNTSTASDWGAALEGTPARQHPTGLRGGGYTPHGGGAVEGRSMALFDGLPPSPAAFAGTERARGCGNRHVHHAGHHLQAGSYQQQQGEQSMTQRQEQPAAADVGQASAAAASRLRVAIPPAAAMQQQQQQQHARPRSPIGPEVRHTKKSAAAAERASAAAQPSPGAAAALQRLKTTRKAALAALSPSSSSQQQQQQEQEATVPPGSADSPAALLHGPPQEAGVQAGLLQHDEGVQTRPATEAGVQAPTPPAPLQLPPDSNAALVAEVRQLRSKLMASLQKHAPELAAGGVQLGSLSSLGGGLGAASGTARGLGSAAKRHAWLGSEDQAAAVAGDSWHLPAVAPAGLSQYAAAPAAQAPAVPPSVSASHTSRRVTDPWGSEWAAAPSPLAASSPSASAAAAARIGSSSSKLGLTEDWLGTAHSGVGGRHRWTDVSAATPSSLLGGGASTASLLGGGPSNASLARLDMLDSSSSGGLLEGVESSFDLGAFEQQTEALRRRLAGL